MLFLQRNSWYSIQFQFHLQNLDQVVLEKRRRSGQSQTHEPSSLVILQKQRLLADELDRRQDLFRHRQVHLPKVLLQRVNGGGQKNFLCVRPRHVGNLVQGLDAHLLGPGHDFSAARRDRKQPMRSPVLEEKLVQNVPRGSHNNDRYRDELQKAMVEQGHVAGQDCRYSVWVVVLLAGFQGAEFSHYDEWAFEGQSDTEVPNPGQDVSNHGYGVQRCEQGIEHDAQVEIPFDRFALENDVDH